MLQIVGATLAAELQSSSLIVYQARGRGSTAGGRHQQRGGVDYNAGKRKGVTMFKDRVINLTTPEAVEEFLSSYPTGVIFKAGTCHKTMQGFGFLQERVEPREDLMVG